MEIDNKEDDFTNSKYRIKAYVSSFDNYTATLALRFIDNIKNFKFFVKKDDRGISSNVVKYFTVNLRLITDNPEIFSVNIIRFSVDSGIVLQVISGGESEEKIDDITLTISDEDKKDIYAYIVKALLLN